MSVWQRIDTWLLAAAPAERLAALRIVIGAAVTVYLVGNVGEAGRLADRADAAFEPVGIAHLLDEPISTGLLWWTYWLVVALGIAFTAGWHYRLTAPLFALGVLGWASYHSSFGQQLHFEHLFTLHVVLLALSPAADTWAVRPTRFGTVAPHVRYGWPIRLLAITTVATYCITGIAKLRIAGAEWLDADTLGNHIGYSATRVELQGGPPPPLASWVLERPGLIAPMAAAALAVELGAPLALLGGWFRRIWVTSAIGFHAATGLTMWVFFGYRGLGIAMLPLFRAERLLEPVIRRFGVRAPPRLPPSEETPGTRSARR